MLASSGTHHLITNNSKCRHLVVAAAAAVSVSATNTRRLYHNHNQNHIMMMTSFARSGMMKGGTMKSHHIAPFTSCICPCNFKMMQRCNYGVDATNANNNSNNNSSSKEASQQQQHHIAEDTTNNNNNNNKTTSTGSPPHRPNNALATNVMKQPSLSEPRPKEYMREAMQHVLKMDAPSKADKRRLRREKRRLKKARSAAVVQPSSSHQQQNASHQQQSLHNQMVDANSEQAIPMKYRSKLGRNKLAQAMAHDIMVRDVQSNLVRFTSFEEKPGKVHMAHNYFVFLWTVLFFGLLFAYDMVENFRTLYYGREWPEVWGHVPIPWHDDKKLEEEFPQKMWPWQKDHPWQQEKRTLQEFEQLKKEMQEKGEL